MLTTAGVVTRFRPHIESRFCASRRHGGSKRVAAALDSSEAGTHVHQHMRKHPRANGRVRPAFNPLPLSSNQLSIPQIDGRTPDLTHHSTFETQA
jgi:hypothetical protein